MVIVARRYSIAGRVQGVGFRYFTAHRARAIGVTGFAHNLPDGSVEVYAEGSAEQIAALHVFLAEGPTFARVDHLDFHEITIRDRVCRSFTTD